MEPDRDDEFSHWQIPPDRSRSCNAHDSHVLGRFGTGLFSERERRQLGRARKRVKSGFVLRWCEFLERRDESPHPFWWIRVVHLEEHPLVVRSHCSELV